MVRKNKKPWERDDEWAKRRKHWEQQRRHEEERKVEESIRGDIEPEVKR